MAKPMMLVVRPFVAMNVPRRGERRLRAEARLRLRLCRDAVRVAPHRGGNRLHVNAMKHVKGTVDNFGEELGGEGDLRNEGINKGQKALMISRQR